MAQYKLESDIIYLQQQMSLIDNKLQKMEAENHKMHERLCKLEENNMIIQQQLQNTEQNRSVTNLLNKLYENQLKVINMKSEIDQQLHDIKILSLMKNDQEEKLHKFKIKFRRDLPKFT